MKLLAAIAVAASVQAVDEPPSWSPAQLSVAVGDTVTWRFEGTALPHNVRSDGGGWSFDTAFDGQPKSYTFTAAGSYAFLCGAHPQMRGTVTVGEAPPPPPPPPSEQPFPNDTDAPTVLEVVDEQRPRLSRVRAAGRPHGIRVRFRLSEAGRVTVRVRRGGRLVASRAVRVRRGAGAVYVGDLRPGRYRLAVRARDLARNASRTKRASATVR